MTYYVNVQTEGTDKYFNSEVEADTIEIALEEAVRQLMQAWLSVPTIHPGQEEKVILTITADLKVTGSSWRIHLKQPCETPCGTCGGVGGIDSGGVDPQGRGIDIPCPSCTQSKAERLVASDALTRLQDEVWGSMGKYSTKLGWGLTGIQPECWTMLDMAVEELKERRTIMEEMRQVLGLKDGDSLVEAVKLLKSTAKEPLTCSCYEPGRVTDPKCKVHGGSWVGGKA